MRETFKESARLKHFALAAYRMKQCNHETDDIYKITGESREVIEVL